MLIITGSLAYDYIMDFPGLYADHILPEKIHNINLSFIVQNFARRRGGTAGNAAYTLALLNTPSVLFSIAGKDFGDYAREVEKIGLKTEHVKIYKNEYTSTGFVMTDSADNQIWAYSYGAAEHIPSLKLKNVASQNDLVLIGPQGAAGSMSFVRQSHALKIPYMFDPGFILSQVTNEDLAFGVTHASSLIGNDYEISLIKERVKNFDAIVADKTVITTLGSKGAIITTGKKKVKIKPTQVTKAVDPTGAGDAWRGGFLAGWSRGYDAQTCGQMGAVAAAYAVEHYGTQEHIYTKSQFTKRYQETYNQKLVI